MPKRSLTILAALMLAIACNSPSKKSPPPAPTPAPPPAETTTEAPPASTPDTTPEPGPVETTTSTQPPPPVTVTIPPPATTPPQPPPSTTPALKDCTGIPPSSYTFNGITVWTDCNGKPTTAPAPAPTPKPATITLTQRYLDSRMLFPSANDRRPSPQPDVAPYGPCHDSARNPIPCPANRIDTLWAVPLPTGAWGVFVHSWLLSGGIPGVHTICRVCGAGDACGIGWPCEPKGTVWPTAIASTDPKLPQAGKDAVAAFLTRKWGTLTIAAFK